MGLIRCKSECTWINQWGCWWKPGSHAGFSYSGRMTLGGYRVGAALHFSYLAHTLLYITLNSITFESHQKNCSFSHTRTLLQKVSSFNMVSILWSTIFSFISKYITTHSKNWNTLVFFLYSHFKLHSISLLYQFENTTIQHLNSSSLSILHWYFIPIQCTILNWF